MAQLQSLAQSMAQLQPLAQSMAQLQPLAQSMAQLQALARSRAEEDHSTATPAASLSAGCTAVKPARLRTSRTVSMDNVHRLVFTEPCVCDATFGSSLAMLVGRKHTLDATRHFALA
jgi:hypothetical protein